MRREAYIAGLFASIAFAVVASLAWALDPVADFIERVAWPAYQPDAHTVAALDFFSDEPHEIPARWQQFRAFITRARNHRDFWGGQFY
jgi:hypothetical protein